MLVNRIIVFLLPFLVVAGTITSASAQCSGFAKKKCLPLLSPFVHNGQLNSVNLAAGESATLRASFYSGQEYKIVMCDNKEVQKIYFEIRNVDDDELLYSSRGKSDQTWNFNVSNTQELIINIIAPDTEVDTDKPPVGCMALLIGFRE